MRHKHADLIHQWAEGAVIQFQGSGCCWFDCRDGDFDHVTLRVKPGTENSGLPPGAVVFSPPLKSLAFPDSGLKFNPIQPMMETPERTQLTVREQFAMEAMKIFLADRGTIIEFGDIAKLNGVEIEFILSAATSRIADAMLKASGVSDE